MRKTLPILLTLAVCYTTGAHAAQNIQQQNIQSYTEHQNETDKLLPKTEVVQPVIQNDLKQDVPEKQEPKKPITSADIMAGLTASQQIDVLYHQNKKNSVDLEKEVEKWEKRESRSSSLAWLTAAAATLLPMGSLAVNGSDIAKKVLEILTSICGATSMLCDKLSSHSEKRAEDAKKVFIGVAGGGGV